MVDSSAIDDTVAEARDLLLGDMATHVLDDVNGRIHAAVDGFHEAFFFSGGDEVRELVQDSLTTRPPRLWKHLAEPFAKQNFMEDIFSRFKTILGVGDKVYVGRDDPRLASMEFQGKPDFVLVPEHQSPESRPIWYDVVALGSVREASSTGYQQAFLQLCGQAQAVFQHQPTRRFLHAFSIYGFTLEFFVFDRAGVMSSEPLDLREDFSKLLEIMHRYSTMTDEQLGAGAFIGEDNKGKHVQLSTVHREGTRKLYTDDEPLAWPAKLLTLPGAFCLQANTPEGTSPDVVVKFIWESPSNRREIEILNHATRRGVWGVPQVLGHQKLASTRDIRESLNLGSRRKVPPHTVQRPSLGEEMFADMDHATTTQGTDKFDVRDNCLMSNTIEEDLPLEQADILAANSSEEFELTCVATAPRGKPLASFKSICEALYALRDAVKAHRSLYEKARILHCDISRNNIIIPDHIPNSDSPRGILIDFDESVDLDANPPPPDPDSPGPHAVEIRGTRAFIAIGVMRGSHHTYRHDLESFLYVLLHIAISYHSPDPPMTSRLNAWQTLDPWPELASKKLAMVKNERMWRVLTGEFTPSWEGYAWLADELRDLLFKVREGKMFIGTEEGEKARERLYDGVIDAFDRAIKQAEKA